jgi:hypothetical protein
MREEILEYEDDMVEAKTIYLKKCKKWRTKWLYVRS